MDSSELEITEAGRQRLLQAINDNGQPAVTRARAKGWSVNPGEMRISGPLDELARHNNETRPGVSTRGSSGR